MMIKKFLTKIILFFKIIKNEGFKSALLAIFFYLKKFIYLKKTILKKNKISSYSNNIPDHIRISIITPVFNTPADILKETIESVRNQTYKNWELCIVDDASTLSETTELLAKYKGIDPRIKIFNSLENLNISNASNRAVEFSSGAYLAFLDHDDTIENYALDCIVESIYQTGAEVLYSDEDKIDYDGSFTEQYFKPDWSPEHLLSVMYMLHFFVIKKSLFINIGMLRNMYSGCQDYDLALRATSKTDKIYHIPKILYHWRKIEGSASAKIDAKSFAFKLAKAAIQERLSHYKDIKVLDGYFKGSFQLKKNQATKKVSILILTNCSSRYVDKVGDINLIDNCVNSIIKMTSYSNYEITIVDNDNMPDKQKNHFKSLGIKIVNYKYQGKFNFSKKFNFSIDYVSTEDLIILNDDIEIITKDWIEKLLAYLDIENVGIVGCQLVYPNNNIQHAGLTYNNENNFIYHIFHNQPANQIGYSGFTHLARNYSAVTGAAIATKRSLLMKLGSFDEKLTIDYNDVDYCFKMTEIGYRVVYNPNVKLVHYEGSTIKRKEVSSVDKNYFYNKWKHKLEEKDPYYNYII